MNFDIGQSFNIGQSFPIGQNITLRSRPREREQKTRLKPKGIQRAILLVPPMEFSFENVWHQRIKTVCPPGKIRIFKDPTTVNSTLQKYWYADMSLTQWMNIVEALKREMTDNPIFRAMSDPDLVEQVALLFVKNQRERWLAATAIQRWKLMVWRRRTQCNVDMIDMEPIKDRDAIHLVDTKQKQIFRFHRRDVYQNLIANICLADEMLPSPRIPTNPWTNVPLTLGQTMSICAQLCMDYAKRGACPPVLLAAFCAARYDLRRFQDDYASMLSHHAITEYFKELNSENHFVVYDTITQLLTTIGLRHSPTAISRWLRKPQTALHHEWLHMVRDYTLYINLHIQARVTWSSLEAIYIDVQRLYRRTVSDLPSPVRIIQSGAMLEFVNTLNTLLNNAESDVIQHTDFTTFYFTG